MSGKMPHFSEKWTLAVEDKRTQRNENLLLIARDRNLKNKQINKNPPHIEVIRFLFLLFLTYVFNKVSGFGLPHIPHHDALSHQGPK